MRIRWPGMLEHHKYKDLVDAIAIKVKNLLLLLKLLEDLKNKLSEAEVSLTGYKWEKAPYSDWSRCPMHPWHTLPQEWIL